MGKGGERGWVGWIRVGSGVGVKEEENHDNLEWDKEEGGGIGTYIFGSG